MTAPPWRCSSGHGKIAAHCHGGEHMDSQEAREILNQLLSYTRDKSKLMGVPFESTGRNHSGPWRQGAPYGAINHYTASNMAVGPKRPLGRLPVLHNRFARMGRQGVGVQFIVWDRLEERFEEFRSRYDLLATDMPGEVSFFGDDLAFWHASWCNRSCYGVEIRNSGRLTKRNGVYFWGQQRHRGRTPIRIGGTYWEPYTASQMAATLWVHRLMAAVHPIEPVWFLGHVHVTASRRDPGPHFPIHEMRQYALGSGKDVPLDEVPFLEEFSEDDSVGRQDDPLVSEHSLHKGMYRKDWDGDPAQELPEPPAEDVDDTVESKLASLGYYVAGAEDYATSVRIFRTRWRRRRGRRTVQMIPIEGGMDDVALKKLDVMVQQAEWV